MSLSSTTSTIAIPEGFMCPDCHGLFGSSEELLFHYKSEHTGGPKYVEQEQPKVIASQSLGVSRTHFESFKKFRKAKIDRTASEANKLLIRLCKILKDLPEEIRLRKAHEQNIVVWIDEKFVNRCPDCSIPFHLLERKHHCRLCGSVMCDNCSLFLHAEEAKSLSNSIQASVFIREDVRIRLCNYCSNVITSSKRLGPSEPLAIIELYTKLTRAMNECQEGLNYFGKIVKSMEEGETLYSVSQATEARSLLLRATDSVDGLSKKIITIGGNGGEMRLQQRIRLSAVNFIRDVLATSPSIPVQREEGGWAASAVRETEEDPFKQQIANLKKFISDARRAGRDEEVETLQASLREFERLSIS